MKEHPLTWSLIIANVAVFLFVFSMPDAMRAGLFSTLSFDPSRVFEIWRWISSLFLHGSASHLFFNMLSLFFFGKSLEEEVKPVWFFSIYFISGIFGMFASMLISSSPVIGASGAIFGVMGAAMLLMPLKKIHLYIFPLPTSFVAITFAVAEAFLVYFSPSYGDVAHIAHIGGLITGAVFALFYETKRALKGSLVLVICIAILLLLGPAVALVAGLGDIIWSVIDKVLGLILYGIAGLFSFLWT